MSEDKGLVEGSATEPKGDVVRGAVVNGGLIIWLVTGHSLGGSLLGDQGAALRRRSGSIRGGRLHGRSALRGIDGDETGIDRRRKSADPKASRTPNSEQ